MMKGDAMASKQKNKTSAVETFWQEFQATRVIWSDGLETVKPSAQAFAAQLGKFAKTLYGSPLGRRAQQHPATAICVGLAAVLVCRRLLRR